MKDKFPNNLKKVLQAKGIGYAELGRAIGESRQQITRIADGVIKLSPTMAVRIARVPEIRKPESLLVFPHEPPSDSPPLASGGIDELLRDKPLRTKKRARALIEAFLKAG